MTERHERCETCRYWERGGAPLSAATRRADKRTDIGTCNADGPVVVVSVGIPHGYLPEMPAERFCGHWRPEGDPAPDGGGDDPDDGERAPLEANVLPFPPHIPEGIAA